MARVQWLSAYCVSFKSLASISRRLVAERQNDHLRTWLGQLRSERRRLEDRLLEGSVTAAQDTRDGLEDAVQSLTASRAALEGELQALAVHAADAANLQVCTRLLYACCWIIMLVRS